MNSRRDYKMILFQNFCDGTFRSGIDAGRFAGADHRCADEARGSAEHSARLVACKLRASTAPPQY